MVNYQIMKPMKIQILLLNNWYPELVRFFVMFLCPVSVKLLCVLMVTWNQRLVHF
ncbi:unnamed protein product [Trichobilharzia regenti]|nr:unnamed protein product [Trichobilharzia regenti]